MGILDSGIIGPLRNKVGPVSGRMHRKQNVISSLPDTTPKEPTENQLAAQAKLGLLNTFLSRIDKLVNPGFAADVKSNSAVNAAFNYNFDHAFIKKGDTYEINYPKMVYSRGHIVAPIAAKVTSSEGKISFSWVPQNQSTYCQYTDMASFLLYDPLKGKAHIFKDKVKRYAAACEIELPEGHTAELLHCYMSFASSNGKLQGNSKYVGEVSLTSAEPPKKRSTKKTAS